MFKKVLVAEDMDDISKGVLSTLTDLGIAQLQHVQYCDDAYLKVKRAELDGTPFELLITDLSFNADHRTQKHASGAELSAALKEEFPKLRIIVYSVEDRMQKVRSLMQDVGVNAYVCKGRHGLSDLSKAVEQVYHNQPYLSDHVAGALKANQQLEIDDFDILLMEKLSMGLSQEEVSVEFINQHITPSSLSSIEKRLNKLKIYFRANNVIHLVSKVKDLGLI
jgi:DNA-binding NarL/FixJ family response regulator